MSTYKATIGVEVHAELKTKSKMFCGCKNAPHSSEPNANICPVCMAHPGTLPTVNKEAVKMVLQVGEALGGELADYSEFDRKNYFYPDIPKAYQLSQYEFPFVKGGSLAGVDITRVHLEEDTARSLHDQGEGSVVDYNRAGVPLMELVTEPVIHSATEAGDFARELQLLLRNLGVSDANMEKGEMRVEANISVSKTDKFGTKVEVKNLNSFKSVEGAIEFEIERQTKLLDAGEQVVQETRGWDENRSKTFSQRKKETADDYRYFPDPDIPKFKLSKTSLLEESRIDNISDKIPSKIRDKYTNLGLTREQIEVIISDVQYRDFFEEVIASETKNLKVAANYFCSDVMSLIKGGKNIADAKVKSFVDLVDLVSASEINSRVAKDLLPEVLFVEVEPRVIAEERGLLQSNSEDDLLPVVEKIVADNESVVAEYRAGKEASLQYLVGQGMKATKGSANPAMLSELLKKVIG